MNFKKLLSTLVVAAALSTGSAFAAIPWGTTGPLNQSSATPTCTYTTTALACINLMTANTTSITLAGMTKGSYYTYIPLQDGTGSRTLAQTPITGAPALTTAESAANGYAVWIIQATSASAATFVADYPLAPLWDTFAEQTASLGTAIAFQATQTQSSVVIPGLTSSNSCSCGPAGALNANWAQDVVSQCIPQTNFAQCQITNPGAATTTPSVTNLNVRIFQ